MPQATSPVALGAISLAATYSSQNTHEGVSGICMDNRSSTKIVKHQKRRGIDLMTLARNARTSVDVINDHHASTVSGEENIALLQSRWSRISGMG